MPNPSVTAIAQRVRDSESRLGNDTRLVLIDGPAGAGKTSLAMRLVEQFGGRRSGAGTFRPDDPYNRLEPAQLLHGDDMYEGWDGLVDLDRVLVDKVIAPLSLGDAGAFRMWSWIEGRRTHVIPVPVNPYLVIEGVGVASRAARQFAALTIYVDAPADVRLKRGLERDGEDMRAEWERWQVTEARHLELAGMPGAADLNVDGTAPVPD